VGLLLGEYYGVLSAINLDELEYCSVLYYYILLQILPMDGSDVAPIPSSFYCRCRPGRRIRQVLPWLVKH